jgi:hypothetical protein
MSQEVINVAESLQYHIEQLFSASKSREGLREDDLTPLDAAVRVTLDCEMLCAEDIGLMNEAADELERATLQLDVQRRIEEAVLREEMDIGVLRGLFCEGNEMGMNNYEGMLVIQQVIQRKVGEEASVLLVMIVMIVTIMMITILITCHVMSCYAMLYFSGSQRDERQQPQPYQHRIKQRSTGACRAAEGQECLRDRRVSRRPR